MLVCAFNQKKAQVASQWLWNLHEPSFEALLARLDPTQWRTKVGLLMILVTLPHNFRNIFYTTNIFSDLIQTFLNWPLITNNYSAGRDRRDPRNGHGHSKKIFRKIWSQWTPGNMQFVKICFHHIFMKCCPCVEGCCKYETVLNNSFQ